MSNRIHGTNLKYNLVSSFFIWYIIVFLYIYSILVAINFLPYPSSKGVTILSSITVLLTFTVFKRNPKIATLGLSGVLVLYTILTQFGLGIVYFFLGSKYFSDYTLYTLRFLHSQHYEHAVMLGVIAVLTYLIAVQFGSFNRPTLSSRLKLQAFEKNILEKKVALKVGILFLILAFIYFLYLIISGQISLNMSYSSFREGVINENIVFSYLLIIYATGLAYVISVGNPKNIKIGILIYSCTAVILLLTGNKGEVLYATLACIGAAQYRGFKIKPKLILLMSALLFIVLPFITSSRQNGVIHNLEQIGFSFTDTFIEIGFQIRVSVYMLEQFSEESRQYIYGFSYINPFVNIIDSLIPFMKIELPAPNSFDFKTSETFSGQGFSQVAESYANFGLLGVIIFYFLLGFFLSRMETRILTPLQLAYLTSIVIVLINVTRNTFAFVIGQIFLLTLTYILIKFFINVSKKSIKVNKN